MLEFLPVSVQEGIKNINCRLLYEIRLRANAPVKINYAGNYTYLGREGVVKRSEKAILISQKEVETCLFTASGFSLYSVSEQMKEYFITTKAGIRIGLAGTSVREQGKTVALRDVTSLCIRLPHPIEHCADKIFEFCERDRIRSCVLLSLPGMGKTTVLREMSRKFCSAYPQKNIMVVDERGEISAFFTGEGCDVLKYAQKEEAFSFGLRSLRPDIIITDELQEPDYLAVEKMLYAGLKVVASAHFGGDIRQFQHKIFERYVVFSEEEIGKVKAIYDENLELLL